jgi:hypothetical protein
LPENRDDSREIATVDEKDGERELAEQRALDWIGLEWKLSWILGDAIKDGVQLGEEARD